MTPWSSESSHKLKYTLVLIIIILYWIIAIVQNATAFWTRLIERNINTNYSTCLYLFSNRFLWLRCHGMCMNMFQKCLLWKVINKQYLFREMWYKRFEIIKIRFWDFFYCWGRRIKRKFILIFIKLPKFLFYIVIILLKHTYEYTYILETNLFGRIPL